VNVIGESAFSNCTGLTSIEIRCSDTGSTLFMNTVFSGITFYDEDGKTVLEQTADNLCGYSFSGTYQKMIKGSAIEVSIVVYHINGGSQSAPTQSNVADGDTFSLAPYSGTRTGYTFDGWNDGTTDYAVGALYTMGTSDVTFTAIWISDDTSSSTNWLIYAAIIIIVVIAIGVTAYYFKTKKNA